MWGIDVSHHQGSINWRSVKNSGIQYAIMKVMYEKSHNIDERFEYNYEQSGLYGLRRGAYIYVIAQDAISANLEALDFVKLLKYKRLERGVWLDLEDSRIRNLSKDKLSEIIKVEAAVLEANGYEVGIYSNLDWYLNVLDSNKLSQQYNWWMARYPKDDHGSIKLVLKPSQSGVTMWQYSSKGAVDGIRGPVDMNFDTCDLGLTVEDVANEVIVGQWGSGEIRKRRLEAAGYVYDDVQKRVNEIIEARKYYPKYTGHSLRIDEVFRAIGVEADFIGDKYKRKHIAEANGIPNYTGTLVQNLKLISLAKEGKLKRH